MGARFYRSTPPPSRKLVNTKSNANRRRGDYPWIPPTQNISNNLCRIHLRGCAVATSDSAPLPPLGQCKYQKQSQPTIVLSEPTIGSRFLGIENHKEPPLNHPFQLQSYKIYSIFPNICAAFWPWWATRRKLKSPFSYWSNRSISNYWCPLKWKYSGQPSSISQICS